MEPIILLAIGLGLVATTAIVFWHQILEWGEKSVFPWFERHLPTIAPYVREAFSKVDNVAVSIRRTVKQAWEKVSQYLLKQVVELKRQSSNIWVQQVTSWVVDNSGYNDKPVVTQITSETEVPYDQLPPDVRKSLIERDQTTFSKNIIDIRKQEMSYIN